MEKKGRNHEKNNSLQMRIVSAGLSTWCPIVLSSTNISKSFPPFKKRIKNRFVFSLAKGKATISNWDSNLNNQAHL